MSNTEVLSPAELKGLKEAHEMYTGLNDRQLEILDQVEESADARNELLNELEVTYNGKVSGQRDEVMERLSMLHEQAEAKKEFSTWGYVKEKASQLWDFTWKHKWWIAGLATAALVGYGYYRYGTIMGAYYAIKDAATSVSSFVGNLGEQLGSWWGGASETVAEVTESATEAAGSLLENAQEMVSGAEAASEVAPSILDQAPETLEQLNELRQQADLGSL